MNVETSIYFSTFGQFIAGMVDGIFIEIMPDSGWRLMLGLAVVPGLIMFYGFWKLPESPRWLALQGRTKTALEVLTSLRESDQEAIDELQEILQSVASRRIAPTGDNIVMPQVQLQGDTSTDDDEHDETALEYGTASRPINTAASMDDDGILTRSIQMISDVPTRRALVLGCGLMVVQQCSGINT
jgi:MFS transporter, SP family, solute carrier family 2 (myo-inositol transporter), member 13